MHRNEAAGLSLTLTSPADATTRLLIGEERSIVNRRNRENNLARGKFANYRERHAQGRKDGWMVLGTAGVLLQNSNVIPFIFGSVPVQTRGFVRAGSLKPTY